MNGGVVRNHRCGAGSLRRVIALVTLASLAGGCPDRDEKRVPAGRGAKAAPSRMLVVAMGSEPPSLVPMLHPDAWSHRIIAHDVLEALVRFDPRPPHRLRGELARSWTVSDDGLTYDFALRRKVRWHDGKPFSSEDVRFTFARLLDEKVRAASTRSTIAPFLESFKKRGKYRFRIVCRRRSPFFLKALADVLILPAHRMSDGDLNHHPLLRAPVGTGPYRFEQWKSGEYIRIRRFERYWGKKPKIRRIEYRLLRNPDLAVRLARKGKLHFVPRVPPARWARTVRRDRRLLGRFVAIRHVLPGTSFIVLNHRRAPLGDVRVRRALAKLLDLKTIVSKILYGQAERLASLYWPGDPLYDRSLSPIAFDPKGAARLLEQAGFRDRDGDGVLERRGKPLRFTFVAVSSSKATRRWLTIYQQQLKKAGIQMAIKAIEWSTFLEQLRGHDFDAAALGMALSGPYTDLYPMLHSSQSEDGQNYGVYSDPRVDRLLERIRREMDRDERERLAHELQRRLAAQLPLIPLFSLTEPGLVSRRIGGVYRSPLWYQLRDWSWAK